MAPRNNTEEPPAEPISNGREDNHKGLFVIIYLAPWYDCAKKIKEAYRILSFYLFGRL